MPPDDPFADLDLLRLPEQIVPIKSAKAARERGEFYFVPLAWADRAFAAVASKGQFFMALRLFRHWRMRDPRQETITASNVALDGPGFSRKGKYAILQKLARAGLVEIVSHGNGAAPRVRIKE